jgi:hypothetical protein
MRFPTEQGRTAGFRLPHVGGAGQVLCRETLVRSALARTAAPYGTSATMRDFARSVLGIILVLAPFALIIAVRVAVGQTIFLWGTVGLVAVGLLVGLGSVLYKAALGRHGPCPASSERRLHQVREDGPGQDRQSDSARAA